MIWITGTGTILVFIYIAATCQWGKKYFTDDFIVLRWMKSSGYHFYLNAVCRICPSADSIESKSYKRMQQIHVKKDISREWKEYQAERYALILGSIWLLCIIASMGLAAGGRTEILRDYTLSRPEYGETAKEYSLKVKTEDGNQEDIHLTLDAQVYSSEEIQEQFEAYYAVLKNKVKRENSSLQEIRTDLDFEPDQEWNAIDIIWRPSDYNLISENGEVLLEHAQVGKTDISLYLSMSHAQYSRTFEVPITIVRYSTDSSGNIQSYLMKEQENRMEEKIFELPVMFDGKKVQYVLEKDSNAVTGLSLLIIAAAFLLLYKQYSAVKEQCVRRERQMKADYPEIISKLLILIRAGMPVRSAWIRIVEDYQMQKLKTGKVRYALEEMNTAIRDMSTGTSEGQAYLEFGKRCELYLYLKLGSLLEQNLKKGNYGIADLLENERIQALEERRRQARAEGEAAGTRLMMPMMVLFALVLMIIMVPSLMTFSF